MAFSWAEVGKWIADAAPIIGGALAGPAGAAVGDLVAQALGTSNSPGAVQAALASDPAAYTKIKALEIEKALEIAKLQAKVQIEQASAEKEQVVADVAEAKHGWAGDWRDAVGWICVAAFSWAYVALPVATFTLRLAHSPVVLPVPSLGVLGPILIGMLGLGVYKTGENIWRKP